MGLPGTITVEHTVWCGGFGQPWRARLGDPDGSKHGGCHQLYQHSGTRRALVTQIRKYGWRTVREFGWVCPACRAKLTLE